MSLPLPSLTLKRFQVLSPRAQLLLTLLEGTHLLQHWQQVDGRSLYYLPDEARGYFIEIGLDKVQGCFVVLRSFRSSALLAEYTQGVLLPV